MLTDTGPLLALVDARQAEHGRCGAAFKQAHLPLVTTWPCFAEAMHLAGRDGGFPLQSVLWDFVGGSVVVIHSPTDAEIARMVDLMAQYKNVPMDLADASIIAAAEATGQRTVFTLDNDFRIYRLVDGSAMAIVPE